MLITYIITVWPVLAAVFPPFCMQVFLKIIKPIIIWSWCFSKQILCDVQLVAGSVEVPAHRVVLASCSPYFCAMFTGMQAMSENLRQHT